MPAPELALKYLKRYLITGLLVWVPLVITVWVLSLIVGTLDQSLRLLEFLPPELRPVELDRFKLPGAGVVLTLLILFFTGLFTANIIGQRLVRWWELLLARIPVVNSVYNGVKQVSDTLFSPGGNAFRKALLVRYPHGESWTIAFMTGKPGGDVANHLQGDYVSVYVPTTPNPTSGFFLMMASKDVIELDMTVDEALKYIISMGVVAPTPVSNQTNN